MFLNYLYKTIYLCLTVSFFPFIVFAQTWSPQTSGTTTRIFGLEFLNENTGWVVGNSGLILKTTDGGATWSPQTSGTTNRLSSVVFLDKNTGWIVGDNGLILKTVNGGSSWTPQASGTSGRLRNVDFIDDNTGWIVGESATILKTEDGGASWNAQNSGTSTVFTSLEFIDANTGWVAGFGGLIQFTNDGATTWTTQNSGTTPIDDIHFINASTGWAVGPGSVILHTTDGGATWNSQNPGVSAIFTSVDFVDENNGWAATTSGAILKTDNGGSSWSIQNSGTSNVLYRVKFVNSRMGWAAGDNGTILYYEDPQTLSVQVDGPNEGWRMLGAPLSDVSYSTLLDGIWTQGFTGAQYESGPSNVFFYDESDRSTVWKQPVNAGNIIGSSQNTGFDNLGTGFLSYIYADDNFDSNADGWPKTLSVTGVAPTRDISKSLSYTTSPSDGYTGWHLISNPYPFTIDWSEVLSDGATSDVNATIQVWDPNRSGGADYLVSGTGGDYDGLIAPFQGFWVKAISSSAQVNFSPAHQASSESNYVKEKDDYILTLSLDHEGQSTWASLVFDDEKSNNPEMYNAARMSSLNQDYIHMFTGDNSGNLLIIQHLPQTAENSIKIPLEVSSTESGTFSLSSKTFSIPSGVNILVSDSKTGESFKLTNKTEYSFTIEASETASSRAEKSSPLLSSRLLSAKTNSKDSRFSLQIQYESYDQESNIPSDFALSQNYPNPFNPTTVINYDLPENSQVNLAVFDMMGRRVATLVNENVTAGTHQVQFDASSLSSGTYMYRLQAGGNIQTKKLTLIK